MTGARSTDEGRPGPDQRDVAIDYLRRAKFLRACAGLERGAEALRIMAMAAHYADLGTALIRGVS